MSNLRQWQTRRTERWRHHCLEPASRIFYLAWFFLGVLFGLTGTAQAQTSLPESQVKALFLFNFAKYVEWPAEAFAGPAAPITIGIVGTSPCIEPLRKAVEGKRISDRPIAIRQVDKPQDVAGCHILFTSGSEKRALSDLLVEASHFPVLTVGETDRFAEQGGVIGFVKKDGKVRLEINLASAHQAKLEISSKLLSVADHVFGR